jgi:hypothetical protein
VRHHRRLLKRLRAEWAVFYDRPSLMRRRGAWHVIFAGGHSYTCDARRCTALQLAIMVNRAVVAKVGAR